MHQILVGEIDHFPQHTKCRTTMDHTLPGLFILYIKLQVTRYTCLFLKIEIVTTSSKKREGKKVYSRYLYGLHSFGPLYLLLERDRGSSWSEYRWP